MKIHYFAVLAAAALLTGCTVTPNASTQVRRAEPAATPVATAPAHATPVWPASAPDLQAQSAILIDANTGDVIFQKNADVRRPVASTQKLLTGLLVARRGHLDGLITIKPEDTRVEPTKLGLRAGERYSRRNLLEAIMVKSCNDACAALARDHSGSEEEFAHSMNSTAWSLGARDSLFINSHGLPANQYSTARDIARVAHRAYRNPDLRRMMQQRQAIFRHNNGRVTVLKATNKLLDRSTVYNGMKTGFTNAAGRCLVSSGRFNGREVILVQLGSKTQYIFNDAERLMAWSARSATYPPVAYYGTF
jgi:D-alanyl-D-alanine carboxypeptidase (penicillin-binding protein 5/6)